MTKIKSYKIVRAEVMEDLQEMVNTSIECGYEPIGGVSICKLKRDNLLIEFYMQAVIEHSRA